MNNTWIRDSHKSADYFRDGRKEHDEAMQLIRVLDIVGLFETSWMIFNHPHDKYGYPR